MNLRKELEPLERAQEFKKLLKNKIENIEYLIENKMDYEKEVDDFNKFTGRDYDKAFFKTYWCSMDIEEVVNNACNPKPKKVVDITKRELVELVKRVIDCEIYGENTLYYLELLEANTIMPEISDLIFHNQEQLTPEEIIEHALEYKPIIL